MTIVYTDTARKHIEDIYNYNLYISEQFAVREYNQLLKSIDILESHPYIAPRESLLESTSHSYRSLVALKGRIKVVYYIDEGYVYITAVWDCRRNPESLIESIK